MDLLRRWSSERHPRTLADASDVIRELCARYDYALEFCERRDRSVLVDIAPGVDRPEGGDA